MTFQKGSDPHQKSGNNISDSRSDKSDISNISRLAKRNELQYQQQQQEINSPSKIKSTIKRQMTNL